MTAMTDPAYTITITVEQGGEMIRKVTMLALDYRFERPFTPAGFAAGLDFEAVPASSSLRIAVPSVQRLHDESPP